MEAGGDTERWPTPEEEAYEVARRGTEGGREVITLSNTMWMQQKTFGSDIDIPQLNI